MILVKANFETVSDAIDMSKKGITLWYKGEHPITYNPNIDVIYKMHVVPYDPFGNIRAEYVLEVNGRPLRLRAEDLEFLTIRKNALGADFKDYKRD